MLIANLLCSSDSQADWRSVCGMLTSSTQLDSSRPDDETQSEKLLRVSLRADEQIHRLALKIMRRHALSLCRSIFPSPEQNPGLSHYQGLLNSGGSLPDLSNLHFPSPLSTPLDPDDGGGGYANLSGGSSTGNLPAAMMHLGIGNSQGGCGPPFCRASEK